MFLERTLEPGATALEVLGEEDFERAWAVRSYTDRGDGMTTAPGMLRSIES